MINDVELLIKGIGKIELDTQLSQDFGINIVYSVDDINNYGARKSSYTKTIKVPGTKNNNKLLGQLYDIKIDGTFDMTIKHDTVLLVNKNPIIDGFMVLNSIEKYLIGDKFQVYYEINIFDEVKNLFDDLGEGKLTDLDFSSGFTIDTYDYDNVKTSTNWLKGNHIFNEETVVSGYTTQFPYYYPIINYGYDLLKFMYVGEPTYEGWETAKYNYPYYGICLGVLYPSVYIKAVLDKIFYEHNYTYTSNFLNGNTYDNLFGNLLNIYNKPIDLTEKRYCSYVSNGGVLREPAVPGDPTTSDYWLKLEKVDSQWKGDTYHYYEMDDYSFGINKDEYAVLSGITNGSESGFDYVKLSAIRIPKDGIYKLNINMAITQDNGGLALGACVGALWEFEGARNDSFSFGATRHILTLPTIINDPGNKWSPDRYTAPNEGQYNFRVHIHTLITSIPTIIGYRINGTGDWNEIEYMNLNGVIDRHLGVYLEINDYIEFEIKHRLWIPGIFPPVPYPANICTSTNIQCTNFIGAELSNSRYQFYLLDQETHISTLLGELTTADIGGPISGGTTLNFSKTYSPIECKENNLLYCQIVLGSTYVEFESGCALVPGTISWSFMNMELQEKKEDTFIDRYNSELNIAQFLPDMTQVDFIRELMKMFNLQIITDKVNRKNLIIEPRDDFYNGSMIDWSDKVDYNKPINIKSLNDKNYRVINLAYSEGSDYLSVDYKNLYGITYGNAKISTENNPLLESENTIELKEQSYLTRYSYYTDKNIICLTDKIDSTWFDNSKEYKPMIGIKTEYELTNDQVIPFANLNTGAWNQYLMDSGQPFLPTCEFISTIGGINYSLEFSGSTEKNLYTLFYKNQITNLQSRNCRYVTMYLDLKLSDILNLTFRKNVTIDGQMYILQKIEYDVTKQVSSKVELLKLVTPYNSGVPGQYNLMSIKYLPGNDDYYYTEDPNKTRIN